VWLATGLACAAACAAYWLIPVAPRASWVLPETYVRLGFVPGRRALLFWESDAPPGPEQFSRGSVRLYDADSGRVEPWPGPAESFYGPVGGFLDGRLVSPDGRWLALGHRRGNAPALGVYDLARGDRRADLPYPLGYGRLDGLAYTADGRLLAFAADGRLLAFADRTPGAPCVRVWDLAAGQEVAALPAAGDVLALAPDGRTLAVTARGRTPAQPASPIHVWDVVRQRPVATLTVPDLRGLVNLWFAPDGRHVAAAFLPPGAPGLVCCWRAADGVATVRAGSGRAGFLPGRLWVADQGLRGAARAVRMFDYDGGVTQVALGPYDWPAHNGVSPDGRTLAVVSVVREPVAEWLAARGVAWRFALKPAERLRFIDVATAREVGRLPSGSDGPDNMFSPDGRLFVTSAGGTIRVWDVPPRRPLGWVIAAALPAVPVAWLVMRHFTLRTRRQRINT
jgi:hypothetical protein